MTTKQQLEKRMTWYADQRDKAYAAIQRSPAGSVARAMAQVWHEKYSGKFEQAYTEWRREQS